MLLQLTNSEDKKKANFLITSSTLFGKDSSLPGLSLAPSSTTFANLSSASSYKKAWNVKVEELDHLPHNGIVQDHIQAHKQLHTYTHTQVKGERETHSTSQWDVENSH